MTHERKRLGKAGEEEAAKFLREKGYRILFRNYRVRLGEIDIICEKDATVIFVEVRSKSSLSYGTGAESVNWQKQTKVRQVAQSFLAQKQWYDRLVRFDVIDVHFTPEPQINHIENAF